MRGELERSHGGRALVRNDGLGHRALHHHAGLNSRSRIILTLLDHPAYPAELARDLDLTRPNVSNHLACLRDCGIVVSEPEGRRTRYEIADSHLAQALTALVDATLAVDEDAPCIDPACSLPGCDAAGEGA